MMGSEAFAAVTIVFMVIVMPVWIVMHYATKAKRINRTPDELKSAMEELWKLADTMEQRLANLEEILVNDDRNKGEIRHDER